MALFWNSMVYSQEFSPFEIFLAGLYLKSRTKIVVGKTFVDLI